MSSMALNHWKKTTTNNAAFTDVERNDEENQQKEVFACIVRLVSELTSKKKITFIVCPRKSLGSRHIQKMRENKPLYEYFQHQTLFGQPLRYDLLDCVNDLFQFWAVSVHTRPE